MIRSPYYVTEKDLFDDVLLYYDEGEFSERLASNIMKMACRIVGSKRFDSCSDLVREEMVSRAYTHACLAVCNKKYDIKHGSRVYSWLSRVLINECLKEIEDETRRKKRFLEYAENCAALEQIEILKSDGEQR